MYDIFLVVDILHPLLLVIVTGPIYNTQRLSVLGQKSKLISEYKATTCILLYTYSRFVCNSTQHVIDIRRLLSLTLCNSSTIMVLLLWLELNNMSCVVLSHYTVVARYVHILFGNYNLTDSTIPILWYYWYCVLNVLFCCTILFGKVFK